MKATYTWNTDAASGTVTADDIDAALEQLVVQGEWAEPESAREQRDIANGAFLIIRGPQESLKNFSISLQLSFLLFCRQFHQHFTRAFFVRMYFMRQNVTREKQP